jgi:riboflavin biosynthesis pyrimidine reductase
MAADPFALETLHDSAGIAETAAERVYGAPLRFPGRPRPYVIANFVATLDGVVSLGLTDGRDAATVGMRSPADRYVMAMLRAAADVVLIGAGTLRASAGHQWTAAALSPGHADHLAAYRQALGKPPGNAPLAVVSASGRLPAHAALRRPQAPVVIVTTAAGVATVRAAFPAMRTVVVEEEAGRMAGDAIVLGLGRELSSQVILCEGGPTLLGALIASRAVRELFLTVAPQLAGRSRARARPGLLEGHAPEPPELPAAALLSVRRATSHLLLRYRFDG